MPDYTMPVRAIKNILLKEIEEFKQGFYNQYPRFIMVDVQKRMVEDAYYNLKEKLDKCESYDELESYISEAGYAMSLEDWIRSL